MSSEEPGAEHMSGYRCTISQATEPVYPDLSIFCTTLSASDYDAAPPRKRTRGAS